jgi:monoamine oxidase
MSKDADVIVVGAGAAGLTAGAELRHAGLAVTLLEARERIGGRMFTLRDSNCNAPIELGAEFIHGRPPEIWDLLRSHGIRVREVDGDNWCLRENGAAVCDFFAGVDEILRKMNDRDPDRSFVEFLDKCCPPGKSRHWEEARKWAASYVSGFNAADPAVVGVHWLVREMRAEEQIHGDHSYRAEGGYASLVDLFEQQVNDAGVALHQNTIVESIGWSRDRVEVKARHQNGTESFSAHRVLITVPLGVLQARPGENGAIQFIPDLPKQKQDAIHHLAMGKVIRVTLRFRERFWESLPRDRARHRKTMGNMSFLFSHDDWFPTWWTQSPGKLPWLTGWAPFRCAERLSGKSESFVVEQSLHALHRILAVSVPELEELFEQIYVHDWQDDPFSRGAYSYGIVGAENAEEQLAGPIDCTLFFAGEATDTLGHDGTVHAAIASGRRAAKEIIKASTGGDRQGKEAGNLGSPLRKTS